MVAERFVNSKKPIEILVLNIKIANVGMSNLKITQ